MENMLNVSRFFCVSVLFVLFFQLPLYADDGSIITSYVDSWGESPKAGWRHFTNPNGDIGNPRKYKALKIVEKRGRRSALYYYADSTGFLRSGTFHHILPASKGGKTRRYAISAYTFQNSFSGDIWLTNINIKAAGRKGIICKMLFRDKVIFAKDFKHIDKPGFIIWGEELKTFLKRQNKD